jgi:Resolvase, N terminal domain
MLISYARVSKADGSQSLDLQRDALREASVPENRIYEDRASGARDDRPGLEACLRALRDGDVLVIWKLDRLGRTLAHLVNTVQEFSRRRIGLKGIVNLRPLAVFPRNILHHRPCSRAIKARWSSAFTKEVAKIVPISVNLTMPSRGER